MATLYLKAAGGNWSSANTWSNVNAAGVDNSGPPTAADDVVLELASGNLTIDAAAACRSLDCTSGTGDYNGTITHNSGIVLSIGDGTPGAGNVALKLRCATYTLGSVTTSKIDFISTSATVQTVDFGGKTSGNVVFNATSNGSWQYTGAHTCGATATVTLTKGTLDINGQTCSWGLFVSSNSNVRTLTLGSSAITITGTSNAFDMNVATNITITANTATVTMSGSASSIRLSGVNMNGSSIVMTGSGVATINGSGGTTTLANFTRTGTAVKTDSLSLVVDLTCTGTFTCNGNSVTNRVLVQSGTVGTARTITAATVTVTNSDFQDITGAGAGSWNLAAITGNSGDCGGNTNITFTTPATQTYTGGTDSWSTAGKWTSRVPLPQDNVLMSGVTGGTITADMPRLGKSIDWTGATGTPAFANTTADAIFGSLTLISGMTLSSSGIMSFSGRSNYTITTAGKTLPWGVTINAYNGTYTLQDALSSSSGSAFTLSAGTFDANNFNVSFSSYIITGTITKGLVMGTGTWSINSTSAATVWNVASVTGLTFSGSLSTISIPTVSANTRIFAGGGLTYGILTYTVAGSTGELQITGANSFAAINFSDTTNARSLKFTAGTTTTIRNRNGFNVQGTSGKLMTVASVTAATHTLTSSERQSCDYLSLTNSIATGLGAWYAGLNSTDGGGNTGWLFTAAPPMGGNGLLLGC